jgi:hypothetical protein
LFVIGVGPRFRAPTETGATASVSAHNDKGEQKMRFMMIMIPNVNEDEWGPSEEAVATMGKYNEELAKAGVLLALDGLQPPAKGARLAFAGGKASVTDGPFTEAKEIVGGYWMIETKSKEEAVQWASRCPAADGDTIEVRQVYEMSDFPPEVQEAGSLSRDLSEH